MRTQITLPLFFTALLMALGPLSVSGAERDQVRKTLSDKTFSKALAAGKNAHVGPIKILSNSRHAYGTIISTIDQLLGRAHTSSEFVIHSTSLDNTFAGNANQALSSAPRYDESGALVASQAPYQLYTSSFTGYSGDFNSAYYNISASYDLADNYAYITNPSGSAWLPPAFRIAPGWLTGASGPGVEWRIDPTIFCSSTLSCTTAANAGILAWLRFNHPTWNWFDTKAALRQTASNWATGYSSTSYGFGLASTNPANALTDGQILLQPPPVAVSTSGTYNQLTFSVFPFKQTRRVKEVLFQFGSNPGFRGNELTLANIQALGGTKIVEYTGTTATTTTPFFTAVTNAYFVWFTADNSTDSAANFSRIDTYSIFGPLSQNEVPSPTPLVTLTANPASVTRGGSATLTWIGANATSCTARGAWSGAKATSGTQILTNLAATGTYTLSCTGRGGTTNQSATITVTAAGETTLPTTLTNLTAATVTVS